jgi:hypothetical protein
MWREVTFQFALEHNRNSLAAFDLTGEHGKSIIASRIEMVFMVRLKLCVTAISWVGRGCRTGHFRQKQRTLQ